MRLARPVDRLTGLEVAGQDFQRRLSEIRLPGSACPGVAPKGHHCVAGLIRQNIHGTGV